MRFSLSVVGLLLAVTLAIPVIAQDRTAEQIIAEYKEAKAPPIDQEKRADPEYRKEYLAKSRAASEKQRELAKELAQNFPDDPNAVDFMSSVWRLQSIRDNNGAVEDIEAYLSRAKSPENIAKAKYQRATIMLRGSRSTTDKLAAVEQFISEQPDSKTEAASLLAMYSQLVKDDKDEVAKIESRILEQYADSPVARQITGKKKLQEAVGQPFELSFTEAITGKQMSMADLKGKVVVIDFWATWCGPCVAEMPKMKKLYADYKDKGVEFIGISLDQPEEAGGLKALKTFCAKEEITWPQYYQGKGWDSEFSRSWGINSIPRLFIIDADGKVHSTEARGKLEKLIPELIEKRDKQIG